MPGTYKPAMSIRAFAQRAVWYAVDSLVCLTPKGRDTASVLLIRLDNIGDFVLWIDSAQHIARHYRRLGKRVLLVAPTVWAGWAEELGLFDEVIAIDRPRLGTDLLFRWKLLVSIRRRGCATAILPAYSHDWSSGDVVIRTCGSREKIGWAGDPGYGFPLERRIGNGWYNRLLPATAGRLMELARNAEFASALLETPVAASTADLTRHAAGKAIAQQHGLQTPYYVLFPGASEAMRRWPLNNFKQVAQRVHAQTGWMGVVCGTAADLAIADQLCAEAGAPVLNLAGKTTLSELTGLLSTASLLVSNDTASVHIAAALGVPTVAALGGGHVDRFLPYLPESSPFRILPQAVTHPMDCFDCGWWCKFPLGPDDPAPCVANIALEHVWQQIAALLSLHRQSRSTLA